MINTQFEAFKIKRELKRSGITYKFERPKKNGFGELSDNKELVGTIEGLYHEQNSKVELRAGDATQIRTKKIPMILCLCEDVMPLSLKNGDIVIFNNKTFNVTGVTNIQEWNIIADISLEVVDNGI